MNASPTPENWASSVNTRIFKPALVGLLVLAVFIGGFGIWAARAPLAGAAIAPGVVAASGQNLRIQHFEGGIIDEIMVREGDAVTKGQPLLRLDKTEALSTSNRVSLAIIALEGRAQRLKAERDGASTLVFSPDMLARAKEANLEAVLDEQKSEFRTRRSRMATDATIVEQTIAATNEKIGGLEVQIKALKDQIFILNDEIVSKEKLLKRGLTRKSEVNSLLRQRADIEGRIGAAQSSIAESRTAIVEANERKNKLIADLAERAVSELNEVRQQINDLAQRGSAAKDVLSRIIIRAPADGLILTMNKNSAGSVVRPGEDILTMLPTGGELIVEARVLPADKDLVKKDQEAKLFFSTLDRNTPEVSGKITYISADQVVDPVSNEPYFPARLAISQELPEGLRREQIFPGLPVETFIQTEKRTFWQYISRPLTDRFRRAFRDK